VTGVEPARHAWNTQFEWPDHAPPYRGVSPGQARQFDELGFFALKGALDGAEVAALRDEIDGYEAELEAVLRTVAGERIAIAEAGAITFTTHLVLRSERARRLAHNAVFADLCADLIGPNANLYWDQAVYKKPEKPRRFPWHQDNGYTYVEPQQYLTCWIALTEATIDNGCPQIAAGQHRRGTLEHRYVDPLGFECFADPDDVRPVPLGVGDIAVFSSLTPHLTGPNTTGTVRKSYILQFAPHGARIQLGDPSSGPPTSEVAADDPCRQFPVLRDGRPVASSDDSALRDSRADRRS
jgi:phytanoyl-CoA hydroxylase